MSQPDEGSAYNQHVRSLQEQYDADEAMQLAVGGQFDAVGVMERALLIQYGLRPDQYLIDVGCGSGRLAKPLAEYLTGPYLGIDIVPDLVEYARDFVGRPEWRFEVSDGLRIPEANASADMVCFFSVLTHLPHEESFLYLKEAKRVLKPGGMIIFSFLEFAIYRHWEVFEWNLEHLGGGHPLNMFMSRDAIHAWAQRLNLQVRAIHDGHKPHIPLPHPIFFDNHVMDNKGYLGQSVCVLVNQSPMVNTI